MIRNRLHASIQAEHLEEAAIAYEHRRLWLEDPTLTLGDLAELEARQEAHLDGLVIGAPHTLRLCERAIAEGDAAELHVAVRVACRCGRADVLERIDERLADLDDDERGEFEAAASAALSVELTPGWAVLLADMLERPRSGAVVAEAIGRRRIPLAPTLAQIVVEHGADVDPRCVRALGELRDPSTLPALHTLLGCAVAAPLWSTTAIACLELGDREVAALVAGSAELSAWSPLAQALSFEVPSAWLSAQLQHRPTRELLTAIALRGDPGSLVDCIHSLAIPELADAAAAALATISGARLLDDAELDEDGELESAAVARYSRDPERWMAWLSEHAHAWPAGARYRLGAPWTPAVARASLASLGVPLEQRLAVRDELAIRVGELAAHCCAPAREQLAWFADHAAVEVCA